MSIDVVYTAESTAADGGRDVSPHSKATLGNIDVELSAKVV